MKNLAGLKIGITVLIGLVIFFAFLFLVGSEENTFAKTYKIKMFVENVEGLASGSMITLGGLKIGYVDEMEFNQRNSLNGITITLTIKKEYQKQVTVNSKASIETIGLLGDKYIDISIGQLSERPLAEGEYISYEPSFDLMSSVNEVKNTLKNVDSAVTSIKTLVDNVNEGNGSLGKFIKQPELFDRLNTFVYSMNTIASAIRERKGFLGQAIYDPALYNQLTGTASDLKTVSDSLKYGKGTLGKLVMDDTLYNNINLLSSRLNTLMMKTADTSTFVGNVLNNDELYKQLIILLKDMKLLITDIKAHPGRYVNFSIF